MNGSYMIDIKRLRCHSQEGWLFSDRIEAIITRVKGGKMLFFYGYRPAAKRFEMGVFNEDNPKLNERFYSNLKFEWNGGWRSRITLLDNDFPDEDDWLGTVEVYGNSEKYDVHFLRFRAYDADYEMEVHTYPVKHSGTSKVQVLNKLMYDKRKDLIPEITTTAMDHPWIQPLGQVSKGGIEKLLNSRISNDLYRATRSVANKTGALTKAELSVELDSAFENVKEHYTGEYLENAQTVLNSMRWSIQHSYVKHFLNLDNADGYGAIIHNVIDPSSDNVILNKFPLSEVGRQKLSKKVYKRIRRSVIIASNKLKGELEALLEENETLPLTEIERLVELQIEKDTKEVTADLEVKLLKLCKQLTFEYPKEYLDQEVMDKMVEQMQLLQQGDVNIHDSGLDDELLDVQEGYGIRPKLRYNIMAMSKINAVEDFAAVHRPTNKGMIDGLGADIFFDIASHAKRVLDQEETT